MTNNVYTNAESLIGRTPLLRLKKTEALLGLSAPLYAKLEFRNPAGSVKDRVALSMICEAERAGLLCPDSVIIEPTSGNTGIGLCAIAAIRGYRAIIVMPESMSIERRRLMAAYGAEVVLSPADEGMAGAIRIADELAKKEKHAYIPAQFDNKANPYAHETTTGPEIYEDTEGAVDLFVAGIGTGGTITGVGRYLKGKKPSVRIIGAEPASSPLLTQGKAGKHGIQGIGANFVPSVLDRSVIDEILTVTDHDAVEMARTVARHEGILIGISSGAALSAAVVEAKKTENKGKTFVVLFPDSGERYLSTGLYD